MAISASVGDIAFASAISNSSAGASAKIPYAHAETHTDVLHLHYILLEIHFNVSRRQAAESAEHDVGADVGTDAAARALTTENITVLGAMTGWSERRSLVGA